MSSDRVRKLGVAYFSMQGVVCLAWWVVMFTMPAWRSHFIPDSFGPNFPAALSIADASLVGLLSMIVAGAWALKSRWTTAATWLLTGATAYATLLAIGAWMATGESSLGAILMAPALACTCALSFAQPASKSESDS